MYRHAKWKTGHRLAEDLTLPFDAVTQKFALIGRSSSGKTYAASKLVELLLEREAQVVIVDPVGVWWGLRLSADGKKAGFDVPIFGGAHGDIPLEATAGRLVADLVVDKSLSLVLDVSDFTGGEFRRFVADFATALLQRKKRARSPLMVIWEECQEVVPQRVFSDAAKMVGAVERLAKQGRNFGIGTTLISQRPQAANKEVLNQTEVLIVFQTTGPQERKAIEGWIVAHGLDMGKVVDELPSLPQGIGYIWSPQWLKVMQKIRVLPKRTYDASATPTFEMKAAAEPGAIDLEAIRVAMQSTLERAKQEDPGHLRQQIAALERQLAKKSPPVPQPCPQVVMDPLDREALLRIEQALRGLEDFRLTLKAATDEFVKAAPGMQREMEKIVHRVNSAFLSQGNQPHVPRREAPVLRQTDEEATLVKERPVGALSVSHRQILKVLAQFPEGCMKGKLAMLSGYRYSGGFRNSLGALRTDGLIAGGNQQMMQITDAGIAALGNGYEPLPSGQALIDLWLADKRLGACARETLRVLVDVYPKALTGQELAEKTGYEYSGGFRNALGQLRTAGLIDGERNVSPITASAHLMGA